MSFKLIRGFPVEWALCFGTLPAQCFPLHQFNSSFNVCALGCQDCGTTSSRDLNSKGDYTDRFHKFYQHSSMVTHPGLRTAVFGASGLDGGEFYGKKLKRKVDR